MSALKQWFACKLGKHFFVKFECEPECCDSETYTFCLHCGCGE